MTILLIITYKLDFSNQVIEYFKSKNICNGFKFSFLSAGVDEGYEDEVLNNIYKKLDNFKSVETIVILSDAGIPTKIAKRIKYKDETKIFKSKNSLIENGFLTYLMLNTKIPVEAIEKVINENIEK